MTLATTPELNDPRSLALLKAVGLDRVSPEQRDLAINIADRLGLDLLLKHLVMVEGRPYVTRDGLLHVAHRSGALDGIETTEPVLGDDGFWRATCSVFRKDMSRPFTYTGRYPKGGSNQRYAPEMAVKVAESMALRRAFDIAAPSMDERWDIDTAPIPTPEPKTLQDRIEEKRATIDAPVRVVSPTEQGHDDEPPSDPVPAKPKPRKPAPAAVVEFAPAEDDPAPEAIPVSPGQFTFSNVTPTMSKDAFRALLKTNRIAPDYALAEARTNWPDFNWETATGEQLAELADFLLVTKDS